MAKSADESAGDATHAGRVDTLTAIEAAEEHARLADEIRAHDKRYYQKDAPSVSDAAYDALRQRLQALEAAFPDLVTPDSPTQTVGAAPSEAFAEARHAVPMLSLDNAFSDEDVADFAARIRRFLRPQLVPMVLQCLGRGGEHFRCNVAKPKPPEVPARGALCVPNTPNEKAKHLGRTLRLHEGRGGKKGNEARRAMGQPCAKMATE